MVAREYTRGARSAGHPGAPDNEETHPRPEPTPEPNAVRAVPEPATERLAVAGERSGPPSPSLPYQEMALVHQNQNQNPAPSPLLILPCPPHVIISLQSAGLQVCRYCTAVGPLVLLLPCGCAAVFIRLYCSPHRSLCTSVPCAVSRAHAPRDGWHTVR